MFCSTENLKSHVDSMATSVIKTAANSDSNSNNSNSNMTITGENILLTSKGNYILLGILAVHCTGTKYVQL